MEAKEVSPELSFEGFEYIEEAGGIEEYRLSSNGMRVLLLPEAAAPVVVFMVTYHVGSRNEATGLTGATHMLEHLMFKGTERFNRRDGTSIFNTLQSVGAQVNATTWFDRTNYYELLPTDHLSLAIEIEADRMRGALINPDDLESERTVILNEFDRGENDPMQALYHAVWSTAFVAHPYHHPTIGWRSDIEGATPDGLRHFYDTFYWPNNATVSIIGEFDRAEALGLVRAHFGSIQAVDAPVPSVTTKEPEQRGERSVTIRRVGQIGSVLAAYKSPPGMDRAADALDILAMVLAAGKNCRLFPVLTDAGLTTHLLANASRLRDPGLFYIFASLTPGTPHENVEAVISDEIEKIREDGITDDELQRAKNQLKALEAFGRDGPYSTASQLNEAIAAGDWKLYANYMDRIDEVTAEDVRSAARQYLMRDSRTVGRYIPMQEEAAQNGLPQQPAMQGAAGQGA